MKLKTGILLSAVATMTALTSLASPDLNNPMTRAVLEVYEEQLKENPTDYHIWLSRANEYYRNSEYMRALNDIDEAIKYVPAKEKEDRIMALMLRANIYIQTDRPAQALEDLNTVLALDPQNYVAIYQRANINYQAADYSAAKEDYQKLMRMNSRSNEAFIGLARIAVKEDNLGMANEYLEKAVANDPSNSDLYVRRATVRRDMGNHNGAVEDLILALAVDSRNNRAMVMLVEYGDENYAAVISGLTDAMRQAPNVGMYPYLRAVIAQHHYHYKAALADFQLILDKKLYDYQGIWRSMAECRFAMGQFDEALKDVDRALDMDRNAGDAALLRARILRAMGRYKEANTQAIAASAMLPGKVSAINELGLTYVSLGDYKEAAQLFAESTLTLGDSPEAQYSYMLRAWMLGTYLNQPVAAKGFYTQVFNISSDYPEDTVAQMFGIFGLDFSLPGEGNVAGRKSLVTEVIEKSKQNPYILYLAACLFAQTDDFDTALDYAKKALEAGYANYYDWAYESDARVNVAPLRDDLRFLNLLERYSHLWN